MQQSLILTSLFQWVTRAFKSEKLDFNSTQLLTFTIILYFEETVKDIYFCKEDEVPKSSIPNVRIRKVSKASFSFSNNWKADSKRAQSHVFLFTDLDDTKIYLSVPDTAFSFQAEGELTLISTTENVGINGFFDFYQPTSLMNVR